MLPGSVLYGRRWVVGIWSGHRMAAPDALEQARIKARKDYGFHSHWFPANLTDTSTSGGVAMLWRPQVEILAAPKHLVPGRLMTMVINTRLHGQCVVGCLYGLVQEDEKLLPDVRNVRHS